MSSNIPNSKANIFIFNGFNIKTNGWNGCYYLTKLELIKDGGLFYKQERKRKKESEKRKNEKEVRREKEEKEEKK